MRLLIRSRIFAGTFTVLAALALGGNIYLGISEGAFRADLSELRELEHQSISMRGSMAYLLATNDVRFLKSINQASSSAKVIFDRLETTKSFKDGMNAIALKNARVEFANSQQHLEELNQDFEGDDAFRRNQSTKLLLTNYQLLISQLQAIESSMNTSWAAIFQLERYISYASFAILLLASASINAVIGKWMIRPFSEGIGSISNAMAGIREKADLNEGEAKSQNQQVAQSTTLINSLNLSADISSQNALKNSELSNRANVLVTSGMNAVFQILVTIDELNKKMKLILENIESTRDRSESVLQIADSVRSQSQDITLLSINAGVLAVNAGVHAQGFGVIADEIGRLALLSKKLADETNEKIFSIKKTSVAAFTLGAEGKELLSKTDQLSVQMNTLFDELVAIIKDISSNSMSVTADSAQQFESLKELNEASQQSLSSSNQVLQGVGDTRTKLSSINEIIKKLQKYL